MPEALAKNRSQQSKYDKNTKLTEGVGFFEGDNVGSDVVGLEVITGLRLGDTVGSDVVGFEVIGLSLGDTDGSSVVGWAVVGLVVVGYHNQVKYLL